MPLGLIENASEGWKKEGKGKWKEERKEQSGNTFSTPSHRKVFGGKEKEVSSWI